jgi:hypothetical protein
MRRIGSNRDLKPIDPDGKRTAPACALSQSGGYQNCELKSGRLLKNIEFLRHQLRKCDRGLVFKISADKLHAARMSAAV